MDSDDTVSLLAARRALMEGLDSGEVLTCPCCAQTVKCYRRALHAGMARQLIKLYLRGGQEAQQWVHVRDLYVLGSSGDYAKLRFWGLVEPMDQRTRGENASGYWRITPDGIAFVRERCGVPGHVLVYNNEKRGEDRQVMITIRDALGDAFSYPDLMKDAADTALDLDGMLKAMGVAPWQENDDD